MFFWLLACTESKIVEEKTLDLSERLQEGEARLGIIHDEKALFAGVSAEGAIGDFKMYNSHVQFIIQSDRPSSYYIQQGGGILDADVVREPGEIGRDIIDEHTVMAGLGRILEPTSFEVVSDGSNGSAHLRVRGSAIPFDLLQGAIENYDLVASYDVAFQVDYILASDTPLLRIDTTIEWNDEPFPIQPANVLLVGKEILHHWNPGGGLEGDSNNGWHGLVSHQDEVALALMSDGESFSSSILQDLLTEATPAISSFGASIAIEEGDSHLFTQYLGVGRDLSDLSDAWYTHNNIETEAFSGSIVDDQGNPVPGARVQIYDQEEAITMTQTDDKGDWSVRIPKGTNARYVASGRGNRIFLDIPRQAGWTGPYTNEQRQQEVYDSYGQEDSLVSFARGYGVGDWDNPVLMRPGFLSITIEDAGPAVVKLFSDDIQNSPYAPGNPHGATQIGYIRDGSIHMPVEAGVYNVMIHRGTQHNYVMQEIIVGAGEDVSLEVSLEKIEIPFSVFGVDAHSHSAPSGDGKVSMEGRVLSHCAHGVDVSISTEHDHAVDFAPLVNALGLGSHLQTIIGSEVSPPMRGHFNAFPMLVQQELVNGGAPI
ncbi:MAG: hypothetical protein CL916_09300, partial [Deltaproteobacteria bacterium]|nr:hypothetical protein [Deltaproteobacteria bacterium]